MLPSADDNDRQLRDPSSGSGFLYRFRDLEEQRVQWVKQIVVDSQIFFASPSTFNDPFDCRIRFRKDGSIAELKKRLEELLCERGDSKEVSRQKVEGMGDPSVFVCEIESGFQSEVDAIGVLSLSSTHEDILMWSHYACGHSGICLQFKVIVDPPFFAPAMPVEYAVNLPVPQLLGEDGHKRAQQLLLTKAADWRYEREWRLLEPNKGPGARSFPPELLSAIILGAKISDSNKKLVMEWIAQRPMPLPVYQAALDVTKYGLKYEQIA